MLKDLWPLSVYYKHKQQREIKEKEDYERRKNYRDSTTVYVLKFRNKETGEILSALAPYNKEFDVELEEKMHLISIQIYVLSRPIKEEEYFKYFIYPGDE